MRRREWTSAVHRKQGQAANVRFPPILWKNNVLRAQKVAI